MISRRPYSEIRRANGWTLSMGTMRALPSLPATIGDRHVHLSESQRDVLIRLCVRCALGEWQEFWRKPVVLPLLIDAGFACVVRTADDNSFSVDMKSLPYRTSLESGTLRVSAETRLVIIRDSAFSDVSALAGLSAARALDLNNTQVSDLAPLAAMTDVKVTGVG